MSNEETAQRRALVRVARRLDSKGILTATDGNLSVRLSDESILITPSGCCKGTVDEEELIVVTTNKVRGMGKPSSELSLHRAIYAAGSEIKAVVHAHPPYATAFAVAGIALDGPVVSEAILALGEVPIARYAMPTREELARSITPHIPGHRAVLLEHHGAVCWAEGIDSAGLIMESLEHVARIDWLSRALGRRQLPGHEVEALHRLRDTLNGKS